MMSGAGLHPVVRGLLLETKLALGCASLYVALDSICLAFPYALPNWFPDHDLVVQHFLFPPPVSCLTLDHWEVFFFFSSLESQGSYGVTGAAVGRPHPGLLKFFLEKYI